MSTLLKPLQVRTALLNRGIRLFTTREFHHLFPAPPHAIKYFLETQTNQELFLRLKNGLYALKTDPPSEEEIANALYRPSYLSFEYALAYYGLLPEMPYKVTSATTKPTRLFTVSNVPYSYNSLDKKAYTGYFLVRTGTKSFLIADKEKAIVDYLYFESVSKKPHNDRLSPRGTNKARAYQYATLFQRKNLIKMVKAFYAHTQ